MNKPKFTSIVAALIIAGMLLPSLGRAQNGFTWKTIKPHRSPPPVKVKVLGKKLTYYPLEKGDEIIITITGPTKMRVLSRIEFGADPRGEKSYYLRYERDDGKKGKFRRVTDASSTAVLADDEAVHLGTSRSVYLNVPDGKHTYRFYVGSKSNYRLYLRFYQRRVALGEGADNVAFTPAAFTSQVPLIVKEEEVTYYRVGEQDTVRLSVIGPSTIKVLCRLEFDPTMITEQKFRVRIFEDGSEKQVVPLRSAPSEVAEYREMSDKIPGKAAKFFIEVPKGKHDYTFQIMDNGRNALLRFFIPRQDLGNNL